MKLALRVGQHVYFHRLARRAPSPQSASRTLASSHTLDGSAMVNTRRAAAGLHVLSRTHLAIDHHAGDGRARASRRDRWTGPSPARRCCSVRLPENLQAIAHRVQRRLGGGQIRLGLLPVLQAAALGIVQRVLAGLIDARELALRDRGAQIVLRLDEFRGLQCRRAARPASRRRPSPAITRVTRPE